MPFVCDTAKQEGAGDKRSSCAPTSSNHRDWIPRGKPACSSSALFCSDMLCVIRWQQRAVRHLFPGSIYVYHHFLILSARSSREGVFCLAAGVYYIWLSHNETPSARREGIQRCPAIIPIPEDAYERSTLPQQANCLTMQWKILATG